MKKILLSINILLFALAGQLHALELKDINSSDQLARFIYQMAKEDVSANKLLEGIESKEKLSIPNYKIGIPIREIFGTIILERFGDKLDSLLFEKNKKYDVREICAFRDSDNSVWRVHITILEEKQYNIIKDFLEKLMKNDSKNIGIQWRGQFFHPVYSLQALSPTIQNSLGVGRSGMEGIADRDGKFNPTYFVDSSLPMRRFVLAGLSSIDALVAIEYGGRGYHIQVLLISLASKEAKPKEIWSLCDDPPESLRELIDKLDSEK